MRKSPSTIFSIIARPETLLVAIMIFGLAINYIRSDFFAHGSDEFAYMRAAQQEVVFQNKEPQIFFPNTNPHLIAYSMGLTSAVSGVDVARVFRFAHIALFVLILWMCYRIGSMITPSTGLLLAMLFGVYPSASVGLGMFTFVPSTVMILALTNVSMALLQRQRSIIFGWLLLVALFYWWGFIPLLLLATFYVLLRRGWRWRLLLLAIGFVVVGRLFFFGVLHYEALFEPLTAQQLLDVVQSNNTFLAYFRDLILIYIPLLLLLVCLPLMLRSASLRRHCQLAIALVSTSLVFLAFSQAGLGRSVYMLYGGLFLLLALTLTTLFPRRHARVLLTALLFGLIIAQTTKQIYTDVLAHPQTNEAERSFFSWIAQQTTSSSVAISDYHTMETSLFFLPNYNYRFFHDDTEQRVQLDYRRVMRILDAQKLSKEDEMYLQSVQEQTGAEVLYVLVTGRTRASMERWHASGAYQWTRVLNREYYRSSAFAGEEKFSRTPFSVVFRQDDPLSHLPFVVFQYRPQGVTETTSPSP